MQSKKGSFIESTINTFIGFAITWICSPLLYWMCDVQVNVKQITGLTLLFTILSILRGYFVRRFFNKTKI